MAEISTQAQTADDFYEDCGYEPELKRTLGSFQIFAVSFAFISVAVGIFSTYDDVLLNAGPVGIWLWVIVAIGQTLVALVIAQFAARIPLSGSLLPMGLATGQPEDRLVVRLVDILFSGAWRGGRRQCTGEPGTHAAARHGAQRGHRARDHGGAVDHSGRARNRFDTHRGDDQRERGGFGTGARRGVGDRADRRRGDHRHGIGRQPHLARCRRELPGLFRHRRWVDARDGHGPRPHSSASTPRPTSPRRPRTPTEASRARSWVRL